MYVAFGSNNKYSALVLVDVCNENKTIQNFGDVEYTQIVKGFECQPCKLGLNSVHRGILERACHL